MKKTMDDEQPSVFASGYLLFRRTGTLQFLLMQHADRWDLPKGHVDPGETIPQAAQRELREETGIPIDAVWTDPDFAFISKYWVEKRKPNDQTSAKRALKQLTIYLGLLLRPVELECTEHLGYRWWNWSPPHRIQTQTIDPLLEQVAQHLEAHPEIRNRAGW